MSKLSMVKDSPVFQVPQNPCMTTETKQNFLPKPGQSQFTILHVRASEWILQYILYISAWDCRHLRIKIGSTSPVSQWDPHHTCITTGATLYMYLDGVYVVQISGWNLIYMYLHEIYIIRIQG